VASFMVRAVRAKREPNKDTNTSTKYNCALIILSTGRCIDGLGLSQTPLMPNVEKYADEKQVVCFSVSSCRTDAYID